MIDETPRELTEQEIGPLSAQELDVIEQRGALSVSGAIFVPVSVDERDTLCRMARRGAMIDALTQANKALHAQITSLEAENVALKLRLS